MNFNKMEKRLRQLPKDVIINHIIPYTYNTQPQTHLQDIRSYVRDYSFLDNIYVFDFNDVILLNDLLFYCNQFRHYYINVSKKLTGIVGRHFMITDEKSALDYAATKLTGNPSVNHRIKIKFIWGLMTPFERTDFINTTIIDSTQDLHD